MKKKIEGSKIKFNVKGIDKIKIENEKIKPTKKLFRKRYYQKI